MSIRNEYVYCAKKRYRTDYLNTTSYIRNSAFRALQKAANTVEGIAIDGTEEIIIPLNTRDFCSYKCIKEWIKQNKELLVLEMAKL